MKVYDESFLLDVLSTFGIFQAIEFKFNDLTCVKKGLRERLAVATPFRFFLTNTSIKLEAVSFGCGWE